ncbi:MAG: hypothetical protein ABIO70_20900 [Pseudomonadota bacterium]
MSASLFGPFPFDPGAVGTSTRAALAALRERLEAERPEAMLEASAHGGEPGLYLLLAPASPSAPGRPSLLGFWVVFGATYLEQGPVGPPERHPPYAMGILNALTEEVWWRTLPVVGFQRRTWCPVIVLEWLPLLANRSALPPPGVGGASAGGGGGEDDAGRGAWLDEGLVGGGVTRGGAATTTAVPVDVEDEAARGASRWEHLPVQRSVLAVIQGRLTHDGKTHRGLYHLLPPDIFPDDPDALPLDTWVEAANQAPAPGNDPPEAPEDGPGQPLALPGGRVGFPATGWLTRDLGRWPPQPAEVRPADLVDRVVQSRWRAQAVAAVGSTLAVLALVIGFSAGIEALSRPTLRPTKDMPLPAPQPAMSVCSADHQQFVDELRCQIARYAGGSDGVTPGCGDPLSTAPTALTIENLQAAFCGLLDRERDGWQWVGKRPEEKSTYAELVASQACFNVLGYPHSYARPAGYGETSPPRADPARFLHDRDLHIASLVDLFGDLTAACDAYRPRVEHRVEGAVFATHIGTPETVGGRGREAADLRAVLTDQALVGVADDAARCFRVGEDAGLAGEDYAHLCGEPDRTDRLMAKRKIWRVLEGAQAADEPAQEAGEDLLDRYVAARFGGMKPKQTTDLWQCHLELTEASGGRPRWASTMWDLAVPVIDTYGVHGKGVRTQLGLDAALRAIDEGRDAGTCWRVVAGLLDDYQPVHPLLAELDGERWSPEQQLCTQVCAAYYGVAFGPNVGAWVTRDADRELCLSPDPPVEPPDLGRGTLDKLRLPWNYVYGHGLSRQQTWVAPDEAEICAFNVLAQGYLPDESAELIEGGKAPAQWAGETAPGSGIAGGTDGLAAVGAGNLSSYGRQRSKASCGHVALQCFGGQLFEVLSREYQYYEWREEWIRRLSDLAATPPRDVEGYSPWCQLVHPYMSMGGQLPEGQLDLPCAIGVDETLRTLDASIQQLAKDVGAQEER